MRKHTRRGILGLAVATTTTPIAAYAFGFEETDPADTVPRRYSVNRFLNLSDRELYRANLAVRRGRKITIEGFSPSESREIIQLKSKDPAAARRRLGY